MVGRSVRGAVATLSSQLRGTLAEKGGGGRSILSNRKRVDSISRDILHGIQRESTKHRHAKSYERLDGSEDYILEDASPFVFFFSCHHSSHCKRGSVLNWNSQTSAEPFQPCWGASSGMHPGVRRRGFIPTYGPPGTRRWEIRGRKKRGATVESLPFNGPLHIQIFLADLSRRRRPESEGNTPAR